MNIVDCPDVDTVKCFLVNFIFNGDQNVAESPCTPASIPTNESKEDEKNYCDDPLYNAVVQYLRENGYKYTTPVFNELISVTIDI